MVLLVGHQKMGTWKSRVKRSMLVFAVLGLSHCGMVECIIEGPI